MTRARFSRRRASGTDVFIRDLKPKRKVKCAKKSTFFSGGPMPVDMLVQNRPKWGTSMAHQDAKYMFTPTDNIMSLSKVYQHIS